MPAPAADWVALADGDRDTLHAAWSPQLLIDITASKILAACPSALTVSGAPIRTAPLHEVEYYYARFVFAADDILNSDLVFGEVMLIRSHRTARGALSNARASAARAPCAMAAAWACPRAR